MAKEKINPAFEESSNESILKFLKSVEAEPEIIFAFEKTGIVVTESNRNKLSQEELKNWNDAIAEFYNPQ